MFGSIKNGVITHVTLKEGGEVEIKCRTNYTLVGSPKLSCINGRWNDSLPSCKGWYDFLFNSSTQRGGVASLLYLFLSLAIFYVVNSSKISRSSEKQ